MWCSTLTPSRTVAAEAGLDGALNRPARATVLVGRRGAAVTVVETRFSVWEALAGRAPGRPVAPADPGLWSAVAERLNPARARPVLRPGIEAAALESVRGVAY